MHTLGPPATTPCRPRVTRLGTRTAEVAWDTDVDGERAGMVDGYVLSWSSTAEGDRSAGELELGCVASATVDGLAPATEYVFKLCSRNMAGRSPLSDTSDAASTLSPPADPPHALRVVDCTLNAVSLSWEWPERPPQVAPRTGYVVVWDVRSGAGERGRIDSGDTDSHTQCVTHLAQHAQYSFAVHELTDAGPGPSSEPVVICPEVGAWFSSLHLLPFHTAADELGLTRLKKASYLNKEIVAAIGGMTDVQRRRLVFAAAKFTDCPPMWSLTPAAPWLENLLGHSDLGDVLTTNGLEYVEDLCAHDDIDAVLSTLRPISRQEVKRALRKWIPVRASEAPPSGGGSGGGGADAIDSTLLGYYKSNGVSPDRWFPGREGKLQESLFNGTRTMAKFFMDEIAYGLELAMLKYLYSDSRAASHIVMPIESFPADEAVLPRPRDARPACGAIPAECGRGRHDK